MAYFIYRWLSVLYFQLQDSEKRHIEHRVVVTLRQQSLRVLVHNSPRATHHQRTICKSPVCLSPT